jgi:hypothetical protein
MVKKLYKKRIKQMKKKILKAILIDVEKEELREITVDLTRDNEYTNDIHRAIKCETFGIITFDGADETSDTIFVDDNGLLSLTPQSKFFYFADAPMICAGNGLILGTTEEGDSKDVKLTIKDYKKIITFHSLKEATLMFPYVKNYL